MPIVPLFGTGVQGRSANVNAQRRINLYGERYGDGVDKAPLVFYGRPGLRDPVVIRSGIPAGTNIYGPSGPPRGVMRWINSTEPLSPSDVVHVVRGSGVTQLSKMGTTAADAYYSAPLFQTESGPISYAAGSEYIVMVDGVSAYWATPNSGLWNDMDNSAVYPNAPLGATSCCYIGQRHVFNVPSEPGRFAWSGLNAMTFDALDYATAEASPDPLVAVQESNGQLLLWGTESVEFWAPSGDSSVYARVGGTGIGWGLFSQQTLAKTNEGVVFVGRNRLGSLQVGGLGGYQVSVLSTPDIEMQIIENGTAGIAAYTFTQRGHSFYVLNLASKTLVLDLTTMEWDEWQTDGGPFVGKYGTTAFNEFLVADRNNSSVYFIDPDALTDNGTPIEREITSRHVFADLDRLTVSSVALDVEAGVGLEEGQGSDPQVMLQVSRDGGHTWGNEVWRSLGALGDYARRVVWNRLGRARDFVFRFRVTDPVKVVFIGASLTIDKGE